MPRRLILSATERDTLLALPESKDDLIRYYTFNDSDLSLIRQRRGDANRLGFAVQLCLLRYPDYALGTDSELPEPVKYGYLSVGQVQAGSPDLIGKRVFCLHPHQDVYVVPAAAVTVVPDDVPSERAVLAGTVETAVNALWDGAPRIGDRVAVVGGGTALLSHLAKASVRLAVNTSPEPLSNLTASAVGDLSLIGVLSLAALYPVAAATVAAVLLVMTIGLALFLLNRVVRGWRRLQAWRAARRATA